MALCVITLWACQASGPRADGHLQNVVADYQAIKETAPQPDRTFSYTSVTGARKDIYVFTPPDMDSAKARPAIVLFHGGGWQRGTPEQFYRQASLYSDMGLVVFLPVYSVESADRTTPRQALEDAFLAWDAVLDLSRELNVDQSRILAGGGSAGGHLAAALATLHPTGDSEVSSRPAALVLFNPVIDNSAEGYGFDRVSAYWETFSPLHNIGPSHPPTLIMLGDRDELIPVATAEEYCERVRRVQPVCEVKVYAGGTHGWFNDEGFVPTLRDSARFIQDRLDGSDR